MTLFTCDPAIEITGRTALAFIVSVQHDMIAPVLKKHGLTEVAPDEWYPLQKILDVLADIGQGKNAMTNFVSIGMAAGELGAKNLPAQMQDASFEDVIVAYSEVMKTRFRNGTTTSIQVKKAAPKHLTVTVVDTAFPHDIYYGVFYGYGKTLLPKGSALKVKYDDKVSAQNGNGDTSIIHITW